MNRNNEHAEHHAKALAWDDDLASFVQAWIINALPNEWNCESEDDDPENSHPSHWTRVVWKGTTELGCALKECARGTIFDAPGRERWVII
ncbi:hypothetical protein RSAG8_05641, partial [Rhizoctonia solani AG-8 WAC10335]